MLASWIGIVVCNLLWCSHLWHRRRHDHHLLLPFFLLYGITDTWGFVIGPESIGGLNLIPVYAMHRGVWVSIAVAVWLSWFCAPVVVAIHLLRGRIGLGPWAAMATPLLLLSVSEFLGFSPYLRRVSMHYCFEPAALTVTFVLIGVYAWRRVLAGEQIDFLAFASFWTALMLGLKILLLLDSSFRYQAMASRAFFAIFMVITVAVYRITPRLRLWLLSSN